jgi:hypothetical protein
MMMMGMIFSRKARGGAKGAKGFSLREISVRRMLHLENEGGIETNSFPPSEFRLPTLSRGNADYADDDDGYDFFSLRSTSFSRKARGGAKGAKGFSLREISVRRILHLENEGGIETNSFPPSEFRLPTLSRGNADYADDDDGYDLFRLRRFFLAKRAGEQRAQRGFSLREISVRRMLHLENEGGIETNSFPPSEFRLPTLSRGNADYADDDEYDFFSQSARGSKGRKGVFAVRIFLRMLLYFSY